MPEVTKYVSMSKSKKGTAVSSSIDLCADHPEGNDHEHSRSRIIVLQEHHTRLVEYCTMICHVLSTRI